MGSRELPKLHGFQSLPQPGEPIRLDTRTCLAASLRFRIVGDGEPSVSAGILPSCWLCFGVEAMADRIPRFSNLPRRFELVASADHCPPSPLTQPGRQLGER